MAHLQYLSQYEGRASMPRRVPLERADRVLQRYIQDRSPAYLYVLLCSAFGVGLHGSNLMHRLVNERFDF